MSMIRSDVITPDAVLTSTGRPVEVGVCPTCGSHPHAGPEGKSWNVDWHCWKCGWRPGNPIVTSAAAMDYRHAQALVSAAVAEALASPQVQAITSWLRTHTAADLAAIQEAEQARIQTVQPAPEA